MGLILAVDVGKGTEDVLIWDQNQVFENAIQMVLPSNTQLIAKQIIKLIDQQEKIVISGEIMAGEPWNRKLYDYAEQNPGKVIMTKESAMSLRYHIPHIENRGIKVVNPEYLEENKLRANIHTIDILWERIVEILNQSGYNKRDVEKVLICCQDHGNPPDPTQSTRDYRMKTIYNKLEAKGKLSDLLLTSNKITNDMPRHKAISNSALNYFSFLTPDDVFVMDSSPAVVLGAMQDELHQLTINVGNGHTIIIGLNGELVEFAYELHTGGVNPDRIMEDLKSIFDGKLTHEESLNSGGHGLFIRDRPISNSFDQYFPITLIGPNREILNSLNIKKVHPIGNMMMAGPYGLVKAYLEKYNDR